MHPSQVWHGVESAEARGAAPPGGWDIAVERGPDWLFLRLERGGGQGMQRPLADQLMQLIRVNHAHRVVVEFDGVDPLDDALVDAIAVVGSRVRDEGGLIRVCGLSAGGARRLESSDQAGDIPHFESRSAAVGPRSGAMR
jgi:anti-anti-sigma regulatory factor